jgi:hypothetical protein
MKLYIKQHNILPDMPDTEVDRMVNMDAHSALEYEDVMISSELLNSSAALASRAFCVKFAGVYNTSELVCM